MKKLGLVIALGLVASCTQPGTPLSPASSFPSSADAGPGGATMKVTAPELVTPIGDVELDDDDPDFEFGHSAVKYGSNNITFKYDFELYEEGQLVQSFTVSQANGDTTSFEIPEAIDRGEAFTWRVRARYGSLVGPWSATGSFKTEPRFSCASIGPNGLEIIRCHRNRFPAGRHPNKDELYEMMIGISRDFNLAGVAEDHPWGVLNKPSGNNCNGISCDIVCSGQGAQQDQYDVLQDENNPIFGSPVWPIRVDTCIYQF